MTTDYYRGNGYSVTPEEALFHWRERASNEADELQTARLVRDITKSDVAVPLPMSAGPEERLSTANFFLIGLEGTAQRFASMQPNVWSPPVQPGKQRSEERARTRRLAGLAWWEMNGMDAGCDEQRAYQFFTYARSPVMIRPAWRKIDGKRVGLPVWEPMDPLAAFPSPSASAADVHPSDCVFHFTRTWGWLLRNHPDEVKYLFVGDRDTPTIDDTFDLVRWVDCEQDMLIVVGRDPAGYPTRVRQTVLPVYDDAWDNSDRVIDGADGHYGRHEAVVLCRSRNLAGEPLVVMPGRWGLDGRNGMMDGLVGLFFRIQRLSALEDDAIERGVFPEEWLVNPNGEARVVVKADGRRGIVGEITNGDIRTRDLNPGYRTTQALERLEGYLKQEGHIPSEFLGENPTGVRTGVRGEALLNAFVSFNLASGHRQFQAAKSRELEVAAAVAKAYFGKQPTRYYVSWSKAQGPIDYRPVDIFEESRRFVVEYPTIGADRSIQQQTDMAKFNNKLMSRRTYMRRDPDVRDDEAEIDMIAAEDILEGVQLAFKTQAANPDGPYTPAQYAKVARLVMEDKMGLAEAIEKIDEEVREKQAAEQGAAPEDMPGLEGAPVPPAAPPSMESLLASLGGAA